MGYRVPAAREGNSTMEQDPNAWLSDPRVWGGDQSLWPSYLRDDALSQVCSDCGRSTWSEFDGFCNMTQPSGKPCAGIFGPELFQNGQPLARPLYPGVDS
jgi:hypothetical protein